ncbi:MAG: hypothetical protein KGN84_16055 [Acidobacteriota bacterium]|nr:hypothetical protein [Acidobacteriota bacterium]
MRVLRAPWRPILISLALFALNAAICYRLFGAGFLNNLSSNDGAFIALSRFYAQHGTGQGWFPWFNAGMPIENAYQPLLPATAALTRHITGWPIARAFHFVLALAYCFGPVTLFWFIWDWSNSTLLAAIASLAFSLTSPAELFIPILRIPFHGQWGALRLYNLIHYAEDPHNVALALLPLALLFIRRAILTRSPRTFAAAVVCSGAVVLSNAFGAVDLAIGGVCIALALRRGFTALLAIGLAGYLWVAPWIPPSMIRHIANDQFGARGVFHFGWGSTLGALAVAGFFALLWFVSRKWRSPVDRFAILFAFCLALIPLAFFYAGLTLVPQANRYQLELELGVCIALACLLSRIPSRAAILSFVIAASLWQFVLFRRYARELIQPVEITQSIEYKVSRAAAELGRTRILIAGSPEYLFNIFSDRSQMSGGHEPTAPNFEQLVAIFAAQTGLNAGARDAEYSLLWMKAFGVDSIYVPGEKSRESFHAVARPQKFDGILHVLWREEDDTIFAVTSGPGSLAHVIPAAAAVARPPIHGLDVEPLRPYVAALDDPALPPATFTGEGTAGARIAATVKPGQLISIQENYAPGWRAAVNGRAVPVRKDGIGLILLDPGCNGPCEIRLDFGLSREAAICRAAAVCVSLLLAAIAVMPVLGRFISYL